MMTLLYVIVSSCDNRSYSRRGVKWVIAQSMEAVGGLRVIKRGLAATPSPHLDTGPVEASLTPDADRTAAYRAALALSETLIDRLEAADVVLASTPVYNYTMPSVLKTWIDLVVRPERTSHRAPTGKVSVPTDRLVPVVSASGGNFDGTHTQTDFLMPYLRYVFATVGIHQMEGIHLQNTACGADSAIQAFGSFWQGLAARMLFMSLVV